MVHLYKNSNQIMNIQDFILQKYFMKIHKISFPLDINESVPYKYIEINQVNSSKYFSKIDDKLEYGQQYELYDSRRLQIQYRKNKDLEEQLQKEKKQQIENEFKLKMQIDELSKISLVYFQASIQIDSKFNCENEALLKNCPKSDQSEQQSNKLSGYTDKELDQWWTQFITENKNI